MVEVNGLRREVIGIMPPGIDVMDNRTEIWMPLGLNPANRQNRGSHFLYLIGRLKDGVTPQAAQAELTSLIQNWGERTGEKKHVFAPLPTTVKTGRPTWRGPHPADEPVQEQIVGGASRAIWVLQAAVGFVLLIACANLANLLLARAETRHREFAVRTALGAGRGRLLRQFMTEGVVLSIAGGALGLLLAQARRAALSGARIRPACRAPREVAVDPVGAGLHARRVDRHRSRLRPCAVDAHARGTAWRPRSRKAARAAPRARRGITSAAAW